MNPVRLATLTLIAASSFAAASAALAAAGGPANSGSNMNVPREQTPKEMARAAYNDGVRAVKKADKQAGIAASATDPRKKDKAAKQSAALYERARDKFSAAVQQVATMHEAWNYLGYTRRKLGELESALIAYDRALALRPTYAEAIEYRGEAYLALNRLNDAKQAYLDLYVGDRKLADQLLAAMKNWVAVKRSSASSDDPAALDAFDQWVQERAQIAAQTASLTRSGTHESWR